MICSTEGSIAVSNRFGDVLRAKRKANGYKSAKSFVKAMECETGYVISPSAYGRKETGDSEPNLSFLIAASITLSGVYWKETLVELVSAAIPSSLILALSNDARATRLQVGKMIDWIQDGSLPADEDTFAKLKEALDKANEADSQVQYFIESLPSSKVSKSVQQDDSE